MKRPPECHWDTDRGWLSPEHQADCAEPNCSGCRPCGKTHCAMRGRCPSHVETEAGVITCPSCIGKVRRDLATIEVLHALMGEEAEESGVDSEAANLAGPAASPEQWSEKRRRIVALYGDQGWCEWPRAEVLADPAQHPYRVLGDWDLRLREQYGPRTDLFITVSRARDFLDGLLAGPFPHGDEFEDFAAEVAACRTHLEAVLHDSRTPEQGRQCPTCKAAEQTAPRLRKRYAEHDRTGRSDTWHCPADPAHWWSEQDYRDRVATDYLAHATALTADQLATRLGIRAGTIRVWANRARIHKRGTDHLGRQLYDVEDATTMRDTRAVPSGADEPAGV